MAYKAPYIDTAGLHIPSYRDILDDLIEQTKGIYGEDIYLELDSQDYEFLSIFALKIYDTMLLLELVMNNRSPKTAVGTALDSLVKLNGIRRKVASYSTVELMLTGDAGAEIIEGRVKDDAGNAWLLPGKVVITESPLRVFARAEKIGDVRALAHTITHIDTPTAGWISVDNPNSAIPGNPVETDTELRMRQSISVATPSRSMYDSLIAGIAAIDNIQRFVVYENDTNQTDENTVPAHSVCIVAEGGMNEDIARVIYRRKGPGTGTYGDIITTFTDSQNQQVSIRFFRPSYVPVRVAIKYKSRMGFTKDVMSAMKSNVERYINTLDIGQNVYASQLWATALAAVIDVKDPSFVITELVVNNQQSVDISFKQVARFESIDVQEVK